MEDHYSTLIVDEDSLFREGLRLVLERTMFSTATCCHESEVLQIHEEPALLIAFAHDPSERLTSIEKYRSHFPSTRIVVLVATRDNQVVARAKQAGANAVLLTSITAEGLIISLQAVIVANLFIVDSRISPEYPISHLDQGPPGGAIDVPTFGTPVFPMPCGLSSREIEIIERIVAGDSNKHIARHLKIAEPTVKAHVKTILRKAGVTNRTQAAIWAVNNGMTTDRGLRPTAGFDVDGLLPRIKGVAN